MASHGSPWDATRAVALLQCRDRECLELGGPILPTSASIFLHVGEDISPSVLAYTLKSELREYSTPIYPRYPASTKLHRALPYRRKRLAPKDVQDRSVSGDVPQVRPRLRVVGHPALQGSGRRHELPEDADAHDAGDDEEEWQVPYVCAEGE